MLLLYYTGNIELILVHYKKHLTVFILLNHYLLEMSLFTCPFLHIFSSSCVVMAVALLFFIFFNKLDIISLCFS